MLEEEISLGRIDNTEALTPFLRRNMCKNLNRLQQSLKSYCSIDVNYEFRNPFLADLDAVCNDDLAKDDLIVLRTMQMLKSHFNST